MITTIRVSYTVVEGFYWLATSIICSMKHLSKIEVCLLLFSAFGFMNSCNVAPQVYSISDTVHVNAFFSVTDDFFAEKTNLGLLHSAHSSNKFILAACCFTALNGFLLLNPLLFSVMALLTRQFGYRQFWVVCTGHWIR